VAVEVEVLLLLAFAVEYASWKMRDLFAKANIKALNSIHWDNAPFF